MNRFFTHHVGVFKREKLWPEWWISDCVPIPFFNNQKLPIIFVNDQIEMTERRIIQLDKKLNQFLLQDEVDRRVISDTVFNHCSKRCTIEKTKFCGWYNNMSGIWDYIQPSNICFLYRKQGIEIIINCDCQNIKGNGIQLLFDESLILKNVSDVTNFN